MAANDALDGVDLDDLNYIQKFPYNGTGAAGGDPLTENLNIWYEVCRGPDLSPPLLSDPTRSLTSHACIYRAAT